MPDTSNHFLHRKIGEELQLIQYMKRSSPTRKIDENSSDCTTFLKEMDERMATKYWI